MVRAVHVSSDVAGRFVAGTAGYIAPEQVLDPVELDPRADVYALAGTIYNVTTGRAFFDEIENTLNYLHGEKQMTGLTLSLHPFLAAYFTKGLPSIQHKWWWRWKKWVKVKGDGNHQYLDFTVQDGAGNEVPL